MIPIDNLNENSSKDFCKGVFLCLVSLSIVAILPIWVFIPILVTT